MTDLFDRAVRGALGDLVAAAPPTPPDAPNRAAQPSGTPHRPTALLAAAAGLIVIAGVVGLFAVTDRDSNSDTPPATNTAAPTTTITDEPDDLAEPVDNGVTTYFTTDTPLPVFPSVEFTAAMNHDGYGMTSCDSAIWTKLAALTSTTGAVHTYQGTLCVYTVLTEVIADSIASCATMTTGTHYARCQHQIGDAADSAQTPPPSNSLVAPHNPVQILPSAPSDAPPIFADEVSATSTDGSVAYEDDTVTVTLVAGPTGEQTCFTIELAQGISTGCLDRNLLTTGLAYGAYQDGDGPIELIGIVPDDVASVQFADTVINVRNNVWHYTHRAAADLVSFSVASADATRTASVG